MLSSNGTPGNPFVHRANYPIGFGQGRSAFSPSTPNHQFWEPGHFPPSFPHHSQNGFSVLMPNTGDGGAATQSSHGFMVHNGNGVTWYPPNASNVRLQYLNWLSQQQGMQQHFPQEPPFSNGAIPFQSAFDPQNPLVSSTGFLPVTARESHVNQFCTASSSTNNTTSLDRLQIFSAEERSRDIANGIGTSNFLPAVQNFEPAATIPPSAVVDAHIEPMLPSPLPTTLTTATTTPPRRTSPVASSAEQCPVIVTTAIEVHPDLSAQEASQQPRSKGKTKDPLLPSRAPRSTRANPNRKKGRGQGSDNPNQYVVDDPDDAVCVLCHNGDSTDENAILFCDGPCRFAYHQLCVAVEEIPEGDWHCSDRCKNAAARRENAEVVRKAAIERVRCLQAQQRKRADETSLQIRTFWESVDRFFDERAVIRSVDALQPLLSSPSTRCDDLAIISRYDQFVDNHPTLGWTPPLGRKRVASESVDEPGTDATHCYEPRRLKKKKKSFLPKKPGLSIGSVAIDPNFVAEEGAMNALRRGIFRAIERDYWSQNQIYQSTGLGVNFVRFFLKDELPLNSPHVPLVYHALSKWLHLVETGVFVNDSSIARKHVRTALLKAQKGTPGRAPPAHYLHVVKLKAEAAETDSSTAMISEILSTPQLQENKCRTDVSVDALQQATTSFDHTLQCQTQAADVLAAPLAPSIDASPQVDKTLTVAVRGNASLSVEEPTPQVAQECKSPNAAAYKASQVATSSVHHTAVTTQNAKLKGVKREPLLYATFPRSVHHGSLADDIAQESKSISLLAEVVNPPPLASESTPLAHESTAEQSNSLFEWFITASPPAAPTQVNGSKDPSSSSMEHTSSTTGPISSGSGNFTSSSVPDAPSKPSLNPESDTSLRCEVPFLLFRSLRSDHAASLGYTLTPVGDAAHTKDEHVSTSVPICGSKADESDGCEPSTHATLPFYLFPPVTVSHPSSDRGKTRRNWAGIHPKDTKLNGAQILSLADTVSKQSASQSSAIPSADQERELERVELRVLSYDPVVRATPEVHELGNACETNNEPGADASSGAQKGEMSVPSDDADDEICQELWLMRRMLALQLALNDDRKTTLLEEIEPSSLRTLEDLEREQAERASIENEYIRQWAPSFRRQEDADETGNTTPINKRKSSPKPYAETSTDGTKASRGLDKKSSTKVKLWRREYIVVDADQEANRIHLARLRKSRRGNQKSMEQLIKEQAEAARARAHLREQRHRKRESEADIIDPQVRECMLKMVRQIEKDCSTPGQNRVKMSSRHRYYVQTRRALTATYQIYREAECISPGSGYRALLWLKKECPDGLAFNSATVERFRAMRPKWEELKHSTVDQLDATVKLAPEVATEPSSASIGMVGSTKSTVPFEAIADSLNTKNSKATCLCNATQEDDGREWIKCFSCDHWYHTECLGLHPSMSQFVESYACPGCHYQKKARTDLFPIQMLFPTLYTMEAALPIGAKIILKRSPTWHVADVQTRVDMSCEPDYVAELLAELEEKETDDVKPTVTEVLGMAMTGNSDPSAVVQTAVGDQQQSCEPLPALQPASELASTSGIHIQPSTIGEQQHAMVISAAKDVCTDVATSMRSDNSSSPSKNETSNADNATTMTAANGVHSGTNGASTLRKTYGKRRRISFQKSLLVEAHVDIAPDASLSALHTPQPIGKRELRRSSSIVSEPPKTTKNTAKKAASTDKRKRLDMTAAATVDETTPAPKRKRKSAGTSSDMTAYGLNESAVASATTRTRAHSRQRSFH